MNYIVISNENQDAYWEYFQNERFERYLNPSLKGHKYYSGNFMALHIESYCMTAAMDGDVIAGICLCQKFRSENERFLNYISVLPEYRGQGIATKLLTLNIENYDVVDVSSSFTEMGLKYLRPLFLRHGIKCDDFARFF